MRSPLKRAAYDNGISRPPPAAALVTAHTRTPVVLPARVTPPSPSGSALTLPTTVVLHTNHPAELDEEAAAACARLRATGVTLLNQSVLLKGVNDDAVVLAPALPIPRGRSRGRRTSRC